MSDKEALEQLSSVRQCFPVSFIPTVLMACSFRYYRRYTGPAIDSGFKVSHLIVLFCLPIGLNILFFSDRRFIFKFSEKKLEKTYDITLSQNMCVIVGPVAQSV